MITLTHLDHSFHSALTVVNFKGGFDTFKFRKGFEEDKTLTAEKKDEILDYLDDKLPKSSWAFQKVKGQIDQQEFFVHRLLCQSNTKKIPGRICACGFKNIRWNYVSNINSDNCFRRIFHGNTD